jgi:hypothetical protein
MNVFGSQESDLDKYMQESYQSEEAEQNLDDAIDLCAEKCRDKCERLMPAQDDPNRPEMVASCVNGCTLSCSRP